jgi:type IV pilus assembly protein PilA
MARHPVRDDEAGFTLIELLVVILIVAILAAIAIPVFFAQREKGYQAQIQSALKNAAVAVETYAVENNGSYAGLDGQDAAVLAAYGFTKPEWATPLPARFLIQASRTRFCLEARHAQLTASSAWRTSTYLSTTGAPVPVPDTCPNLNPLVD